MVISNYTQVLYYSPKAQTPDIIRPFSNAHWQTSRTVLFQWIYNGFDLQLEYQLQVYPFNSKENDIPDEWFELIEDGNDDVSPFVGSAVVDVSLETLTQETTINFSSISPLDLEDGSYLWRVRTKGNVANEWSDWNPSGRVNLDAVAPFIRNAFIETSTNYDLSTGRPNSFASCISDLSSPFMFSERTVPPVVEDRHIDRENQRGLLIYYDYRDSSFILRAQKGGSATNKRYYGLISFHADDKELTPDYSIPAAVKAAYLYTVNRGSDDGPFEQSRILDSQSGDLIGNSTSEIVTFNDSGSGETFIPKGFPTFINDGIYSQGSFTHLQHPVGFDESISFFTPFPLHTRIVTRKLDFSTVNDAATIRTNPVQFDNVIEMRYPAPYQDLFILFDQSMTKIMAYGQYDNSDLANLDSDNGNFTFQLLRGLDVEGYRNEETKVYPDDNVLYQFWTTASFSPSANPTDAAYAAEPNQRGPFPENGSEDVIRSPFLFYSLNTEDNVDNALKIYIKKEALSYPDDNTVETIDSSAPNQIPYIDFQMSPETDCILASEPTYEETTSIEEVYIGKAKLSPKGLAYSDADPTDKIILRYPKTPPIDFRTDDALSVNGLVREVQKWGCDPEQTAFSNDETTYNASFRLKIPSFKYVPYYHPSSVNYAETPTNTQPPIPHIYDADPNQDVDDVIGWDTITIESKEDEFSAREAVINSDLVYQGDYVRFMGTSRTLGQINPFTYNFDRWKEDDIARGTISHIRDIGIITVPEEYKFFGQAMYEAGWGADGIIYNGIDRGLYSVGDIDRNTTSTTTELYLQSYANYLFRRSVEVKLNSTFAAADDFTNDLFASDGVTLLEETVLNTSEPSWIFALDTTPNSTAFRNALIGQDDTSAQAHFGPERFLEDASNPFGGYYLVEKDSDTDTATQVKRNAAVSGSAFNYTTMSPLDRFDIGTTTELRMTGDTFSLGNLFGQIITSPNNTVRIFFDVKEASAGIRGIKVFQADIETDPINIGDDNENLIESSQYIGPMDLSGNDTKIKILMQKINNKAIDYGSPASISDALTLLSTARSPFSLIQYYFNNNITSFENADTANRTCLDATSGVIVEEELEITSDQVGFFHEISIVGDGLKIIYIQVEDRSGNVSNIYPIPVFIASGATIEPAEPIESATIHTDDGMAIIEKEDITVPSEGTFTFETNLLPIDQDKSRAVVIKKIIVENDTSDGYKNIESVNDLITGFSDNYGLNFNVFSPFSSINTWRFTRPIEIRVKSFTEAARDNEPYWYFDPNHVRHYKTNTDEEIQAGYQVNNSLSNITLLGFQVSDTNPDEDSPIARTLMKFKDEFIGKEFKIGNALDQSFRILHVFKGSLDAANRLNPAFTIDASDEKVWLVIEDPDEIAALIASRKFQYANNDKAGEASFDEMKKGTFINDKDDIATETYTDNFGYTQSEEDIDTDINDIVNAALGISGNVTDSNGEIVNIPSVTGNGELTMYITPSSTINNPTETPNDEGWITQIFQVEQNFSPSPQTMLENLDHKTMLGIRVYDKLVFGESTNVEGDLKATTQYLAGEGQTAVVVENGSFDETMAGLEFAIRNVTDSVLVDISVGDGTIKRVSNNGEIVMVDGDVASLLDLGSKTYKLIVTVDPLDSTNSTTGQILPDGWWPNIDGIVVPPYGVRTGTVSASDTSSREEVAFAVVSNGAFYIPENGDYRFVISIDNVAYADFSVDFLRMPDGISVNFGTVQDLVEDDTVADEFNFENVGGLISSLGSGDQTYYLTKGWHIGRFRYITNVPQDPSTAKIEFHKERWTETDTLVPFIGDNSGNWSFLARGYRSVHCRILDSVFTQFPSNSPDPLRANQFCRAVVGFIRELEDISSSVTTNQVALIEREDSPEEDFGERILTTISEVSPTFAGQLYEEAFGVYVSNIFDAGSDFRFWRTLSWTPSPTLQPSGTTVQFEIRTADTEEELLNKNWNSIGTGDEEQILSPFTQPGADILKFSFPDITDPNNQVINRLIQFRMTLKSRVRGVTPTVNDVTITYSKQNSVNFFTTTFNLEERLLRAILVFNGEQPVDQNGVAITDIQFGLSTEEVSEGVVTTNFDNYTIIPDNEAFSLSSLGIQEGENFRVGIRLVASSEAVPTVDEFAMLFEMADGTTQQLNRGL